MKNIFIITVALFSVCLNISAQEKSPREKKGDKYAFIYSYDKAIIAYKHTKHLSVEGQRRLADSYHKLDCNIKSEEIYAKMFSASVGIIPEDYYNYSMVLKSNGKYNESIQWMNKFKEIKPNDLRVLDYTAHVGELSIMQKDAGNFKTSNLNTNSAALDFGPAYYKNQIVFASTRTHQKMIVRNYNWTGKPFWDMYVSDVDGSQLKRPKIFAECLNGRLHDGPASFSNDGNFMAFTRNNYDTKRSDKVVELEIYFSSFKDGKWQKAVPFFLNNNNYSVGQPFLTSDGLTMYFTSDMPGGFGGADLYKITKDGNGIWGTLQNLGDKINTEGDEMYPFIEANSGTLYFTSNGRFGLGGLDIFIAKPEGSGFGIVQNAGYPINSQFNDYAVILNDKLKTGYFTSDRPGGSGGDDIYFINVLKPNDSIKEIKPIAIENLNIPADTLVNGSMVKFTVNAPKNIPSERKIREIFPLRNYIFFNIGSTEIPDRYVLLKKDQVKDFKEEQVELFTPKNYSGRSERQMIVYYNVLNILGDRMGKNPTSTIKLVGSSAKGPEDGKLMAESVKGYLVNIFGIKASRLSIEGRDKPVIPSEQPGGERELDLLREGDQRVSIESNSPALLMEFQSGPDAPLKPVEIISLQEAPVESYVTFNVEGAKEAFKEWSLEIKDENGLIQNYGPYTRELVSMPAKTILGTRSEATYNVTMIGQSKSGQIVKMETAVSMALWAPPKDNEVMRFSIIYEFNDSKAIALYERYITDILVPKISSNSTVIIHGYTDIIGDEDYNQRLSLARAMDVKKIIDAALYKTSRVDVKFETFGFGEDQKLSLFENKFPEERFYNRTVMIDIIPKKVIVAAN